MAQTVCIILRATDRQRLAAIVPDRNRQRKHIERAEVVLASAEGGTVQQIAGRLDVGRPMVWRWQQRFAEEGVWAVPPGAQCGQGARRKAQGARRQLCAFDFGV
jgi:transposase